MKTWIGCLSLAALAASSAGCIEIRRADEGGGQEHARAEPAARGDSGGGGDSQQQAQADPKQSSGRSRYQPDERGAKVHPLPARYRPLTRIVGKAAFPFQSRTSISTIGDACYTPDLDGWLKKPPPGTPIFEATILHEQVHAKRQIAAGVDDWVDRYLHDRAFMWAEEQRGWYVQLTQLKRRGLRLDTAAVGRNLAKYSNLGGKMVDAATGQAWADDVLRGRWQPE